MATPQTAQKKVDIEYHAATGLEPAKAKKLMAIYTSVQSGEADEETAAQIDKAKKAGLLVPNKGGPKAGATPTEKQMGRTGSVMAGAILGGQTGAAVGSAAGPVGTLVGGAAGAAIGAGGGSLFFDGLEGLLDYFGFPETNEWDTEKALQNASTEAAWEIGTAGVAKVGGLIRQGAKALKGKALGVRNPEALERTEALKGIGVTPNVMDVSTNTYIRDVFPKVIGRFPLIAGPFVEAGERTARQVTAGIDRHFVTLGPAANLVTAGQDLKKLVDTRFTNIVGGINDKYKDFLKAANKAGTVVPVSSFAKPILTASKTYEAGLPIIRGVGRVSVTSRMGAKTDPVMKLLGEMSKMDGNLTPDQYQTLMNKLDTTMSKVSKDPRATSILFKMRGDMEKAFRSSIKDPAVVAKLKDADSYLQKVSKTLSSEEVKSISGTTKVTGFQINLDKPGTLSTDELLENVYRGKPGAYDDLVKLAGKPQTAAINRAVIGKIHEKSFTGHGIDRKIDLSRMIKEFAMDLPSSQQNSLWRKAFKDAGSDYDQAYQFLKSAQVAMGKEIPDVATFAARRAMLGGWRSLVGLIMPTAATAAGGATGGMAAIGGIFMTRHVAKILTDPKKLAAAQEAIDVSKPVSQRQMAWLRLFTLMGMRPSGQGTDEPNEKRQGGRPAS